MSARPVEQNRAAFTAYGIEVEYMLVDRATLAVRSIADQLIEKYGDAASGEIKRGELSWSNELVSHVIELKNPHPTDTLSTLVDGQQQQIHEMNQVLAPLGACLMPTAMHPWMNPRTETRLWTLSQSAIYQAYDRVFDCRSHGWANLQSMHVNLPFNGDLEFARLHAAIRLVLPILPAVAASSPIAEGIATGNMDHRMEVYRHNATAIPVLTGLVIPETVSTRAEYEADILAPMYEAIAPVNPEGTLQHEWLNSTAQSRFDRSAIDSRTRRSECPQADMAIAAATIDLVKLLYDERLTSLETQQSMTTEQLANVLRACIRDGDQAEIGDPDYLALLGYAGAKCKAGQLWQHLSRAMLDAMAPHQQLWKQPLLAILENGCLARRIVNAIAGDFSVAHLRAVYRTLCHCLDQGHMFAVPR
jgi:hypothetical protein